MLADLSRPEAYPPPVPSSVECETTHASWVFLTDAEVRKIKRPVNLSFLDYGTVARREAACHEELRLGRRLAPGVYRDVVPVYHGRRGYSFVGPGTIVDHAVLMRRLPREQSAVELLRAGKLDAQALRNLAERLAGFYQTAARAAGVGGPAELEAAIDENWRQTLGAAGTVFERAALETLHGWQLQTLEAQRARIASRVREGWVRDGHGDVRLEHVYFPDGPAGQPIVIDPIEFNRSFRCVDVALDVSFLAMELDAAGRGQLGAWFLSCFARASNDYGFFPLLSLYLSHRAWVRAKVASFLATDPSTPPGKATRKRDEAVRLLALAVSYTRAPAAPAPVIAVGGMIGAGKSTAADALGFALRLPVISSDLTRKHLAGLAPSERADPEMYSEARTQQTYQEMLARAHTVLESGRGVVLDATFRSPELRSRVRALASAHGRPFLFVEMTCDEATIRARLRARSQRATVSDARESLLPWMSARYQAATELPAADRIAVDGAGDTEALVETVRLRLAIRPGG